MKKEMEASGRCIEQAQLNQRAARDCEELQSQSRKWRSMKLAVHEAAEQPQLKSRAKAKSAGENEQVLMAKEEAG